MNKRKITSSYWEDYCFIINNNLSLITNSNYNKDIINKAESLDKEVNMSINSFNKLVNDNSMVNSHNATGIEQVLKTLDHWTDFYNALFFKYTLNITTSKNGFKYYQLKGSVAVIEGKKIWVNYSLGTEANVIEKFETTNSNSLIEKNANEMILRAYKKLREIREQQSQ